MIKLGIVGTNWISKSFLESALASGYYDFTAIYSRKKETAVHFCQGYNPELIETDFNAFAKASEIDVVYIASPNSVHFEQAKILIQSGKSIVVEKPAFSNDKEFEEIIGLSQQHDVLIFEAARHIHEKNFSILKQKLDDIGEIVGGNFTYMKYSSRYNQVLLGEEPNIFSLKFSGGALVDLGVYLVYAAIKLFGIPQEYQYICQKINTGVDGIGTIVFRYETFDVTMQTGKITDSFAKTEIYGSQGTLIANSIECIDEIYIDKHGNRTQNLAYPKANINMIEEAEKFAELYLNRSKKAKEYERLIELARHVNKIITELRKQENIIFDADK